MFIQKLRKDKRGFTLVELVVAIGILSLFMPLVVGMMNSSVKAKSTISETTNNNLDSSAVESTLNDFIGNAVAVKLDTSVANVYVIQTKGKDGNCKNVKIEKGIMTTAVSNKAIVASNYTNTIADGLTSKNNLFFTYSDTTGILNYNITFGNKVKNTISSSISPTVTSSSQGVCW